MKLRTRERDYNLIELFSLGQSSQTMSANVNALRSIRKVTDTEQQQTETYRYWHSLSIGDRLSGVWDVSEAAYSFAAAFKGVPVNDAQGSERFTARVQRPQR